MDSMDNQSISLTQKRSQVRVLFRPLCYPQGWGFLFAIGYMWGSGVEFGGYRGEIVGNCVQFDAYPIWKPGFAISISAE